MNSENIIQNIRKSGALLDGHFLLTSGRHSDKYFEKFLSSTSAEDYPVQHTAVLKWLKDIKLQAA